MTTPGQPKIKPEKKPSLLMFSDMFSELSFWVKKPQKKVKRVLIRRLRLRRDNRIIRDQEKRLLETTILTLGKSSSADVSKQLRQLDNTSLVLEKQIKWKITEYGSLVIGLICLLFIAAILPGFSTPGHVQVRSSAVELVLSEDFEWVGDMRVLDNESVLLSHFSTVDSAQAPKLHSAIESELLDVKASDSAVLESLFIPQGTRLWLELDEQENDLVFVFSSEASAVSEDSTVRAGFRLFGEAHFAFDEKDTQTRDAIPCPTGEDCRIGRRVLIAAKLSNVPRIRIPTLSQVDLVGIQAKRVSFSKFLYGNTKRQMNRCTVSAGTYQFRGEQHADSLRRGECIIVESEEGFVGIDLLRDEETSEKLALQVWYHGIIESVKVGTIGFTEEKTPTLLTFILGYPGAREIGSILGVILAASFALVRIKK